MIKSFANAFDKMFTLSGRDDRPTYWWYFLDYALYWLVFIAASYFIIFKNTNYIVANIIYFLLTVMLAFGSPMIVAMCTAIVRRLHDANFSGWWFWLWLVPVVGKLILLIMLVFPTHTQNNRYNVQGESDWIHVWWTWVVLTILAILLVTFLFPLMTEYFDYMLFLI